MTASIFEQIINKQVPAEILFEDDLVIAIKDINPAAPIHFLVIPKHKIVDMNAASAANNTLLGHCLTIGRSIMIDQKHMDYRIVINTGEKAGQTVPHLHLHFMAGRPFTWPPG